MADNIYSLWESNDSALCPLSKKQLSFIDILESKRTSQTVVTLNDDIQDIDLERLEVLFSTIQGGVEIVEDQYYKNFSSNLLQIQSLLSIFEQILDHIHQLKNLYVSSCSKTDELHESSEVILQQQHNFIMAVEAINDKLAYFKELEPMTKKLSSPSVLVLGESLMPTLSRLDECIAFMKCKSNFKESSHYLFHYRLLQSQTLLNIKNHVINSIQTTSKQVLPESGETLSPGDSIFTLFYGKFQSTSHRIKSLMTMIEERINEDDSYQNYLKECHKAYFIAREILIVPVLTAAIEEMVTSHQRSYCTLTRNSCRMLLHICKDEYRLFFQFFSLLSDQLSEFLEKLCSYLYDFLRPIVIHTNHLEILSELCCIIKHEVIEEFIASDNELASFGRIMNQLLQDVQERLVHRTNIYIQVSIIEYSPSPGDLAYPEKLEMMESIAESMNPGLSRSCSLNSVASIALSDISFINERDSMKYSSRSPADMHGMWYPTVRRTIMCLSKLFRSLDKPTFQGLGQEVVAGCLTSLNNVTQLIIKNKTPMDGYLFLIKHLLIVREQITPFRIECSFREVEIDFSRVKTAALALFEQKRNIFSLTSNNSLLKFLFEVPGAPQVMDHVLDPQHIVDTNIKSVCEKFIHECTNNLLQPLKPSLELLKRCLKNTSSFNLPSIEEIAKCSKEFKEQIKIEIPKMRKAMSLYLSNPDTENILFKPIRNNLCKELEEFNKLIIEGYKKEEQELIGIISTKILDEIIC